MANKNQKFVRLTEENFKEAKRLIDLLEKRMQEIQGRAEKILIKALREKLGLVDQKE